MLGGVVLFFLTSVTLIFLSTSIDYLFLLFIVYAQARTIKDSFQVSLGHLFGTNVLIGISLMAAYVLNFIPQQWVIGLLGLIPIYLGLRYLKHVEMISEDDALSQLGKTTSRFFWTMAFFTIASGGDNIGIYIPYFLTLSRDYILIVIILINIFVICLCLLTYRLARMKLFSKKFVQYESYVIPIVYFLIGIYILFDNGTINFFMQLLF